MKTRAILRSKDGEEIKNTLDNSVILDGVICAIDGRQGDGASRFIAADLADGALKWSREKFGYGSVIGIGDSAFLALTELGELVAVRVADKYEELGRRQALGKTCWTTPVFADGRIYARNDRGDLVCLAP